MEINHYEFKYGEFGNTVGVHVNLKGFDILRLNNDGFSTIRLEPGSHTITLTKDISNRNKLCKQERRDQ